MPFALPMLDGDEDAIVAVQRRLQTSVPDERGAWRALGERADVPGRLQAVGWHNAAALALAADRLDDALADLGRAQRANLGDEPGFLDHSQDVVAAANAALERLLHDQRARAKANQQR